MNIGAYVPGASQEVDLAVQARPKIVQYLQQEASAACTLEQARIQLGELAAWIEQLEKTIKAQHSKASGRPVSAAKG